MKLHTNGYKSDKYAIKGMMKLKGQSNLLRTNQYLIIKPEISSIAI
jgi:hypothetical protein